MSSYERYVEWRRERRRRKEETYEARRARAFEIGKRVEYFVCPLCGANKPFRSWRGGRTILIEGPPYKIIMVRYGAGRGIGFFEAEEEATYLDGLRDERPELFEELREKIIKLAEYIRKI